MYYYILFCVLCCAFGVRESKRARILGLCGSDASTEPQTTKGIEMGVTPSEYKGSFVLSLRGESEVGFCVLCMRVIYL
jgi:hypothetical protein